MSQPGAEAVEGMLTPQRRKQEAEEQAAAQVWGGTAVKRALVRLAVLREPVRVAEQAQQVSLALRVVEGQELQVKQEMVDHLKAEQRAREVR